MEDWEPLNITTVKTPAQPQHKRNFRDLFKMVKNPIPQIYSNDIQSACNIEDSTSTSVVDMEFESVPNPSAHFERESPTVTECQSSVSSFIPPMLCSASRDSIAVTSSSVLQRGTSFPAEESHMDISSLVAPAGSFVSSTAISSLETSSRRLRVSIMSPLEEISDVRPRPQKRKCDGDKGKSKRQKI